MQSALLLQDDKDPRTWDMPTLRAKRRSADQIRSQAWQCKFCGQPMTPRMGSVRTWYFAHQRDASTCPFHTEAEHESEHHRLLKRASAGALGRHFGDQVAQVEYEVRIPAARRIADALITLKDGTRIAVEAQLASITLEHLQARTSAYVEEEIEVIWVFAEERLKPGGLWADLRAWLLSEGHLVLTAKTVIEEKTIPLGQVSGEV